MRNILLFTTFLFCCSFGYQKDKEPVYKGKVKTVTETNKHSRRKTFVTTRRYDAQSRITERTEHLVKTTRRKGVENIPGWQQLYTYNEKGQLIRTTERYLQNVYGSYNETEYKYDEKGNQTEAIVYSIFSPGAPRRIRITELKRYNDKGQLIEVKRAGPDKKIGYDSTHIMIYKYEYPDDSTRVESWYDKKGEEYVKSAKDVLDKRGDIIKHVYYEKGKAKHRQTFQYNEDGNILKSMYEGESGMHMTTNTYEDMDEQGNHKKMTRTSFESPLDSGKSSTIIINYEYYE